MRKPFGLLLAGWLVALVPVFASPQPEEARILSFETAGAGYLGIRMRDVNAKDKTDFGLQREMGIVVESVETDSPAAAAGFQEMDVVMEFAGIPVLGARQFQRLVAETPVGRKVAVRVWRGGRAVDLDVEIGERKGGLRFHGEGLTLPDGQSFSFQMPDLPKGEAFRFQRFGRGPRLGISGASLTGQMAEFLGIREVRGVLVMEVTAGSPAEKAGLQAGDVILSVDGKQVAGPDALSSALKEGLVQLEVNRKGRQLTLSADLGEGPARPSAGTIRM